MITTEKINDLLEKRKNRVLTCAQIGMDRFQFEAFRKILLDEFGNSGFLSDLERLFANSTHKQERYGMGRHILRKKRRCPMNEFQCKRF